MHRQQRDQTHALLQSRGIKQAIFTRHESVKWLTGVAIPVQVGTNLFAAGPAVVWYNEGHFWLIVLAGYAGLTAFLQSDDDITVVPYNAYRIDGPIQSGENLRAEFSAVLQSAGVSDRIGVEMDFTPLGMIETIRAKAPVSVSFLAVDSWLEPLRTIKTAEEINKLRRNFALTDLAHGIAREVIRPGLREIDVWTEIHTGVQRAAGQRVAMGNDLVIGRRDPDNIGGWPLDLEIQAGDSVIVDISTIHEGYWSDSCNTYYATEPTDEQLKMRQVILEALDLGYSLLRPGAVAKDIDSALRNFIEKHGYPVYPHHTGHSVGVSGHENPRITPYSEEVLQAGMVIMLEPGTYFAGRTGVRLEDGYLITEQGAERLTSHLHTVGE